MIRPKKPRTLAAVRPNAGIEAMYRRALFAMTEQMQRDILTQVRAAYAENTPRIAMDFGSPAKELQAVMGRLGRKWRLRFDRAAPDLARYFATTASKRADGALASILKRSGFAVTFKLTAPVNDIVQASVAENVTLIKSIAARHMAEIEGHVMRSVQTGRDLASLTQDLESQFGVTRRRAAFIARDQNNKATAVITRARQAELGITEAIWLHSGGGRHPRPEHVAFADGRNGGPRYDIAKGAFLEGRWTWPGVEINCRCVSKAVLPFL